MMSSGIDTGTSQANLNFGLVKQQGYSSCYVKLGGDNSGRYVAPWYVSQVDRARGAGLRVGHYWVPRSGMDPIGAADYFVNNLRGWTAADFVVLDNESLDGSQHYSDHDAAVWVRRVQQRLNIGGRQVKVYLALAVARTQGWPECLATGCDFVIAAYSYGAFQYALPTIPADRNGGHQTGGAVIGGIATDTNVWKDNAFDYSALTGGGTSPITQGRTKMWLEWDTQGTGWLVTEQGWTGLPNMQVYTLFQRVIRSNQGADRPDTFLRAEVDIMAAQQRAIAVGVQTGVTIDPVKLASAISDALGQKITATVPPELLAKMDAIQKGVAGITLTPDEFNITASVDPAALAAAFNAAVPRVAKAILKAQGDALSAIPAT
jgi:hypothetical protein